MPIYEYRCRDCGERSEYRVSAQTETAALSCRSCGGSKLEKLISAPVISSGRSVKSGQTCCGRDQRCSDAGQSCGH